MQINKENIMLFIIPSCQSFSIADLHNILVKAACGTTAFKCDCYDKGCYDYIDLKG